MDLFSAAEEWSDLIDSTPPTYRGQHYHGDLIDHSPPTYRGNRYHGNKGQHYHDDPDHNVYSNQDYQQSNQSQSHYDDQDTDYRDNRSRYQRTRDRYSDKEKKQRKAREKTEKRKQFYEWLLYNHPKYDSVSNGCLNLFNYHLFIFYSVLTEVNII